MAMEIFSPSITPPKMEELVTELTHVLRSFSILSESDWSVSNLAHKMVREKGITFSDVSATSEASKIVDALLHSIAQKAMIGEPTEIDLFSTTQARAIGAMKDAGITSRSEITTYLARVLFYMGGTPAKEMPPSAPLIPPIELSLTGREILRRSRNATPKPRDVLSSEKSTMKTTPSEDTSLSESKYWWLRY